MTLDGYVDVRPCPFCGNDNLQHYKTVSSPPSLAIDFCGGKFQVRALAHYCECKTCGLIVQTPRMTDERIALYYSSGIYRGTIDIPQIELDASEHQRGERIAAWLKEQKIAPASHLDVGCSRTYLLEMVNAPERLGFDMNTVYAGNGIYVEGDPHKLGQYELVTAIHVLEHTPHPAEELLWYRSLSTRWILIEVPQIGAPLRFPHLFYFPPAVLTKMVQNAGMRVLKLEEGDVTRILAERA